MTDRSTDLKEIKEISENKSFIQIIESSPLSTDPYSDSDNIETP